MSNKEPPYHAILMTAKGETGVDKMREDLLRHPRINKVTDAGTAWVELKGNFRQWPKQLTQEVMGERRFDIMVIPTQGPVAHIGRATAECVMRALEVHMPVYIWKGQGCKRIRQVECWDQKDWKTGWRVS